MTVQNLAFQVSVTTVFITVAIMFLFPSTLIVPLDRRTAGLLGAMIIMNLHYFFSDIKNAGIFVDFHVLLILFSIMLINFVLLNQPVIHDGIKLLQREIVGGNGFWLVSFFSFVTAPFILNDGVCLILTTPVLDSFQFIDDSNAKGLSKVSKFYFMLTICCSANIGSGKVALFSH